MDKISFVKLILLGLIFLFGNSLFLSPLDAAGNFTLSTIQECSFEHAGDNCTAFLKAINNTGYVLAGTAFLQITYQGQCSNNQLVNFDGQGIQAGYSPDGTIWLDFAVNWTNGETKVSNFTIAKGVTYPELKIKTNPALCPGTYKFTLSLWGTYQEQQYQAPAVIVGGGGAVSIPRLTISNENVSSTSNSSAVISWQTNEFATSRVIYDTVSHRFLGNSPNYDYAFSTPENLKKVTVHKIVLLNLLPGTTYYYRCVSHASPDTVSPEYSFTTLASTGGTGGGEEGAGAVGGEEGAGTGAGTGTVAGTSTETGAGTGTGAGAGTAAGTGTGGARAGQQGGAANATGIPVAGAGGAGVGKFLATIGQFFYGLSLRNIFYIILVLFIILLILLIFTRRRKKEEISRGNSS